MREAILRSSEPLDASERKLLEEWLEVLKEDVAQFGEAPEDTARMEAIKRRLE